MDKVNGKIKGIKNQTLSIILIMKIKNLMYNFLVYCGLIIRFAYPRPAIKFIKKNLGKDLVCAEIGVYKGENAKSILKTLDIKKIYLIDPYLSYKDYKNDEKFSLPELKIAKLDMSNLLIREIIKEKAVLIKKRSSKCLSIIPNNLDFVYIDGNHDYKYVKEDIKNYWKKIRIGGILCGHDFDFENDFIGNKGVITAVIEFAYKNKLQLMVKSPDWWILKND